MQDKRSPVPARAGIGLRFQHHERVRREKPAAPWLEVHTENYMGGGFAPKILDQIREIYPLSLHGVGLSLGSAEGLCTTHLARLRAAIARFEPALVSEHLSWSVFAGTFYADLLPLPLTEESLSLAGRNIDHAQEALGRQILVENPSTYLQFKHTTIPEWEFLGELAGRTGCGLLCDINNIYVSASNHGWNAEQYLSGLPAGAIGEIHLAGHTARALEGGQVLRIDDHGSAVCADVWALYERAVSLFGALPTLIEWDTDVPALETLLAEAAKAARILDQAEARNAPAH